MMNRNIKPEIIAYYLSKIVPVIIGLFFVLYAQKNSSDTNKVEIQQSISTHIYFLKGTSNRVLNTAKNGQYKHLTLGALYNNKPIKEIGRI